MKASSITITYIGIGSITVSSTKVKDEWKIVVKLQTEFTSIESIEKMLKDSRMIKILNWTKATS